MGNMENRTLHSKVKELDVSTNVQIVTICDRLPKGRGIRFYCIFSCLLPQNSFMN